MQRQKFTLGFIVVLTIAAIAVIVNLPVQLGLDLRGGSQLTLQVMTTPEIPQVTPTDLSAVRKVIDNRINELGVSEALVQTAGNDKLVVQLPGVSDPEQAERVLGNTARLEFREQKAGTEGQYQAERQIYDELKAKRAALLKAGDKAAIAENQKAIERSQEAISQLFEKAVLTGQDLREAGAAPDGGAGNSWVTIIRFSADAADRYAELTKKLAGTGRGLGIFLDRDLLTAPVVGAEYAQLGITGGSTEIRGNFTAESAQELVIQLKGGALPLPVKLVETRTVGATLGRDSVESSIWAGVGGLVLVLIFMALYYRLPGIVANLALIIYAILNFAVFALVPVTLSLPGIAGFILSIGMAVDANVLIFERTREELQAGKSLYRSVESGFYRAFSSILDGNVTTIIACVVLFWLGSGLVKGFALTLAIGVLLSMFTALTCSRTLLFVAISFPSLRRPEWFCPGLKASAPESSV
ncbi:MAG TPA: protein translocase subunit SecD [Coleofasciculaceae cyanobacterium]